MRSIFIIAAIILLMSGCHVQKQAITNDRVVTVTNTVHDTTIVTKPDRSLIGALLHCDSTGHVYMSTIEMLQAGYKVKPTVTLKDNYITLECKVDSQAVYIRWKEQHITDVTQTTLPPVYIEKNLSWWQTTQIWAGRLLFVLILLLGVYLIIRFKSKLKFI